MSAAEAVRPASAPRLVAGASVARASERPLRVLLAGCVAASVAAHGWMAVGGGHGAGWSLAMAAMAVACSFCLPDLVRRRDAPGPVGMALCTAVAMAVLHVLMIPLTEGHDGAHPAHHGGVGPGPSAAGAVSGGAGHGAVLALIVLELTAAALAAGLLRRRAPDGAGVLR